MHTSAALGVICSFLFAFYVRSPVFVGEYWSLPPCGAYLNQWDQVRLPCFAFWVYHLCSICQAASLFWVSVSSVVKWDQQRLPRRVVARSHDIMFVKHLAQCLAQNKLSVSDKVSCIFYEGLSVQFPNFIMSLCSHLLAETAVWLAHRSFPWQVTAKLFCWYTCAI